MFRFIIYAIAARSHPIPLVQTSRGAYWFQTMPVLQHQHRSLVPSRNELICIAPWIEPNLWGIVNIVHCYFDMIRGIAHPNWAEQKGGQVFPQLPAVGLTLILNHVQTDQPIPCGSSLPHPPSKTTINSSFQLSLVCSALLHCNIVRHQRPPCIACRESKRGHH